MAAVVVAVVATVAAGRIGVLAAEVAVAAAVAATGGVARRCLPRCSCSRGWYIPEATYGKVINKHLNMEVDINLSDIPRGWPSMQHACDLVQVQILEKEVGDTTQRW